VERAGAIETLFPIRIVSAASVLREPVHGPNWIAAGIAALAFDPLTGLGVHKAIESGLPSSAAIASSLGRRLGGACPQALFA
jgi:flavin-dependent dehydrogenase